MRIGPKAEAAEAADPSYSQSMSTSLAISVGDGEGEEAVERRISRSTTNMQ